MSRDRTTGNGPALLVSCLFVLVVVATLRWRAQVTAYQSRRPDETRVIDLLPQRVGAEIRAADVLRSREAEQHREPPTDVLGEFDAQGQPATPAVAILSRVENAEQPQVQPADFPEFNLLKDEAYQRSRAQALADRAASIPDSPAVRSPALSKIVRELHVREMQKRQSETQGQTALGDGSKTSRPPGINLTAQPALGPPQGALSWPEAKRLFEELKQLQDPLCQFWARKVQSGVDALRSAPSIYDPTTTQALAELVKLTQDANQILERVKNEDDKSRLLIAAYGLRRRTDVWRSVAQAANPAIGQRASKIASSIDRRAMLARLDDLRRILKGTPHEQAWADYLKLDALEALTISPAVHDVTQRSPLARIVLGRCSLEAANDKQRKFLSSPAVANLERELRRWVTQAVDLQALVYAIEDFELNLYERHAAVVTEGWNRLRWSALPEYKAVAEAIDLHYRNANLRISVTEDFMNRMIPAMQNVKSPVREHIMGAQVRGLSTSNMQLHVDLMDDPQSIRMRLEADGRLAANTQSTKGPVTINNFNRSNFVIEKLFVLDRQGVHPGPARAAASGNSSIIGLQTRYDTFPVLGAMVRRVAQQRAFESRPLQRRIFENRVAANARKSIDSKVSRQLEITQKHIGKRLIDPLAQMELDPTTIALSSSDDRAFYRGRLAGDHQLAGFTARPKAANGNYLSMQMHASAVNNFLRQLELDGKRGSIREVIRSVLDQIGFAHVKIPVDVPDDVTIALAKRDSVRIDCDDDRVSFTLTVAKLETEHRSWSKFAVRAHYAPQINGFQCELHRDGIVELSGRRASNDLALRAIFVKVFSKNRSIPIIHPEVVKDRRMRDLQIDQFIARDGWIGISVGKRPEVRSAIRQHHRHHYRR